MRKYDLGELLLKFFCFQISQLPPEERVAQIRKAILLGKWLLELELRFSVQEPDAGNRIREFKREMLILWTMRSTQNPDAAHQ